MKKISFFLLITFSLISFNTIPDKVITGRVQKAMVHRFQVMGQQEVRVF